MAGTISKPLSGWGRYPVQACELTRPERYAELKPSAERVIVRGQGRSYGDASLNADGHVILSERLNRILEFDAATGLLRAEAGVWAWVSLAMVSNLLRRTTAKFGRPLDVPHYLELSGPPGQRLAYRLISRTAWELVKLHGSTAIVALGSKRSPWGEMAEQLSSRQQIFAHPCFWAIAHRFYLDAAGNLRPGATSQRPAKARKDPKNTTGRGGVRRLPSTFRQFDRTYNTRELTLEQALPLWPNEYAKWKAST